MPRDPASPRPLYRDVAARLRARIVSGDLPPGAKLPTEPELVAAHQVSLNTVRQAIAVLRAEGLVVSRAPVGIYVRERPLVRLPAFRYSQAAREPGIGPFTAATRRAGVAGDVVLLGVDRVAADAELAVRLEVDEGDEVVVRRRHLRVAGRPVQLYDGFYAASRVDGTPLGGGVEAGKLGGVANTWAELGITPEVATEEVRARAASIVEAEQLQISTGMPVLTVTRVTRDTDGQVLEVLRVVADAESVVFVYEDLPLL